MDREGSSVDTNMVFRYTDSVIWNIGGKIMQRRNSDSSNYYDALKTSFTGEGGRRISQRSALLRETDFPPAFPQTDGRLETEMTMANCARDLVGGA